MLNKINHTQISNDFLDIYMDKLSGAAVKVFLTISRKTIGWHKDTDYISYSQLENLTGLSVNTVKKAIKELKNCNLIEAEKTKFCFKYSINYKVSNSALSKNDTAVSKTDIQNQKTVSKTDTTKEINKETIIKESAFNKFWDLYDYRKNKKKAKQSFMKIPIKEYDKIFKHIPLYLDNDGKNKQYRKHPTSYINGECWNDEIVVDENKNKSYDDILRGK